MKLALENKYTLLLQIEKNNMMFLQPLKGAQNMGKFTIKNKIIKQWLKFTNLLIIAN